MAIDRSDRFWYRDAVVYQMHIKAFFDSNDDGIGDFAGLIDKLDYIRDLGVSAIWLLPFYPSPLRDDGYDIAHYDDVNPMYGKIADFRKFLKAAHERGLRVVTELVVNHTSDQHPWFQRARKAKPGSPHRDYYVWSDTDQKYLGTRIIFLDTEKSNWTWDPVAQAYYWHRFYSHQPDLNFENPKVLREIINAMHFWLEIGVDGLRLDAVPYLRERDGTNNENLPETHEVLQKIRAEVDAHYPDRMLLAEANQWPEDTQEYFGKGDECHMAFHFPLMPRMYMAIAQEDRHPITDILRQTPEIPPGCQWAIFLRNHDELTLEMVTDQERDYLWNYYATDRRARINLGIRRRLAPLMENDRRKVELMTSLLLSMPGTPIVYYGDEIGMGDNIYLGDRDGVRTPMQWSPDRNGGFSKADPARLFLPTVQDPMYGFQAVNVEAQMRNPSSLLNWVRRMIAVRQGSHVFGRGDFVFLYPSNRRILAFVRQHEGQQVLCIANVSRTAQAVELDLSQWRGRVPRELLGGARFPAVGELAYVLTLPAYGFYWLDLQEAPAAAAAPPSPEAPEFVTLVLRNGVAEIAEPRNALLLERDVLPAYLPKQRWFAAKDATIRSVRLTNAAALPGENAAWLGQFYVDVGSGETHRYFLPLALSFAPEAMGAGSPVLSYTLAKVRRGARIGPLYDATADEQFPQAMLAAMAAETEIAARGGKYRFVAGKALATLAPADQRKVQRLSVEQSNTSIVVNERAIFKLYRRLAAGIQPEIEVGRHLTEVAGYANTPPYLGHLDFVADDGATTALAVAQGFVASQGDGWTVTIEYLKREIETLLLNPDAAAPGPHTIYASFLVRIATLGRRIAGLHRALALGDNSAFKPEPMPHDYFSTLGDAVAKQIGIACETLARADKHLDDATRADVQLLTSNKERLRAFLREVLPTEARVIGTRLHADLHLGQVLAVQNDWYVLGLEGDPVRPLSERRGKGPPAKDVASMLRSFDYAARFVAADGTRVVPNSGPDAERHALGWRDAARTVFVHAYDQNSANAPGFADDEGLRKRLIDLYAFEKAVYEITYEAANRPSWLRIPVRGLLELTGLISAGTSNAPQQ